MPTVANACLPENKEKLKEMWFFTLQSCRNRPLGGTMYWFNRTIHYSTTEWSKIAAVARNDDRLSN